MTTPDRLSVLYHRALERAPADRHAFLDQACAGDTALRAEVESLLRFDAKSFLETPAAVAAGPDMTGRRLGPYTIVGPLGAGGMGEVYRARDTKLGRDVAIKILPAHFTSDPERRARFAREARLLATLNHPHIGAIYGLEEANGLAALVLELVEGPTLAHRLLKGPIPIPESLQIARQIAEALDAAHQKGIIHRDLKPANIVLQPADGPASSDVRVKVLDFGLAKSLSHGGETVSLDGTGEGRVLGTPAYMSPEQARGLQVDKRTDVWAFGCVLYEMLSGQRAFAGATLTDTLARILDQEPDWTRLPARTPAAVNGVLERCLRKNPRNRLHDIADARIELDDTERSERSGNHRPTPEPQPSRREHLAWILAGLAAAAACVIGVSYYRASPVSEAQLEFPIAPPQNWSVQGGMPAPTFELSPDGRSVVINATLRGVSTLWIRTVVESSWRELPGTEDAVSVFWSPDSQSVGFFTANQLKTLKLGGGAPLPICPALFGQAPSGAWSRDDLIVFGGTTGLFSVSASGGTPSPATSLGAGETAHRWPSFLPDGRHFLYMAQGTLADELRIGSIGSSETESLGRFHSNARYAGGHLLFVYNNRLMAQPFDADARRLTGDPVTIVEPVAIVVPWARGQFSVSQTGRLAYSATGRPMSQLMWKDRSGTPSGNVGESGYYNNVGLSADDTQVVVSRFTEPPGLPWNVDIWSIDVVRGGGATRLTLDPGQDFDPTLSPDGKKVAFNSNRTGGVFSLFERPSNPGGDDTLLIRKTTGAVGAPDWSADGHFLIYVDSGDLWTLAPSEGRPSPFLRTPHIESNGTFSPNGRWVAYQSDVTGRTEVYVRPFPPAEREFKISGDSGRAPRWRGDGKELFFLALDGTMMAVDVDTARAFHMGVPHALFPTTLTSVANYHPYAVARDGKRFLIPVLLNPPGVTPISVVFNWPARLRK